MRTTLDIDDDLITALRPVAAAQHRSLGRVVSDLIRSSMRSRSTSAERNGFPLFEVPTDAPLFGSDAVAQALDE
jgi:hypothetical protein